MRHHSLDSSCVNRHMFNGTSSTMPSKYRPANLGYSRLMISGCFPKLIAIVRLVGIIFLVSEKKLKIPRTRNISLPQGTPWPNQPANWAALGCLGLGDLHIAHIGRAPDTAGKSVCCGLCFNDGWIKNSDFERNDRCHEG